MAKIVGKTIIFQEGEGNIISLLNIIILISNTDLKVSQNIYKEMRKEHDIRKVPKRKLYKFFKSLVMSEKPSRGLRLMEVSGLLKHMMPELYKGVGCYQNEQYHTDDTFTHCIKACDAANKIFEVRAAALLHDVGKPFVKTSDYITRCTKCGKEDKNTNSSGACGNCGGRKEITEINQRFFKHEVKSDTVAKNILKRFGVPKKRGLYIASLVRNHMYMYSREWTNAALMRFIDRVGMTKGDTKNIERFPLFLVREADRKSRGLTPRTKKQEDFENRLIEVLHGKN